MVDSAHINSEWKHSVMLNAVCNEPVSLKVLEEPFYRKGFSPFVNKETGTWWEYDDDKKGFFDTGIIAQGRDGETVDVQIDGKSIVADGIADVPLMSANNYGVAKTDNVYGISAVKGLLLTTPANKNIISGNRASLDNPVYYRPITSYHLDYAVKAAMCDGKGAAWTPDEQAAARERMSVENGSDFELLVDATLEEEANSFVVKFPKPVKECLYHVWFFNNNADKARLYTECFDFDTKFNVLLKYSTVSNNNTCAIEGYFKHNANLPNKSVYGIANETITDLWVSDSYANGSYAWAPYTYSKSLNKVDAMKLYLADKSHVLNAGAVIRVWGR